MGTMMVITRWGRAETIPTWRRGKTSISIEDQRPLVASGPQNTPRDAPSVCYLANLEAKHLLKVRRLADEKQVESPASAEIGHNDGVNWHGCEEGPPWRVEFLQQRSVLLLETPFRPVLDCFSFPFLVPTALGV